MFIVVNVEGAVLGVQGPSLNIESCQKSEKWPENQPKLSNKTVARIWDPSLPLYCLLSIT